MAKLEVQVWSDIACPWCYVGKRRLEAALARFEHRDEVELTWRAFELDPGAPRVREGGGSYAARLAAKYRCSLEQAEQMIRTMTETAAADGVEMRFDRIRPGNTFDAHRLIHLAAERELADQAKERLLCAYLTEGRAIGEPEVLVELAGELGIDADEVWATLSGDRFAAAVRDDEARASALGIHGVPFFVIDDRYGLSGAQPAELLHQALEQAWHDRSPALGADPDGEACGPDGCG